MLTCTSAIWKCQSVLAVWEQLWTSAKIWLNPHCTGHSLTPQCLTSHIIMLKKGPEHARVFFVEFGEIFVPRHKGIGPSSFASSEFPRMRRQRFKTFVRSFWHPPFWVKLFGKLLWSVLSLKLRLRKSDFWIFTVYILQWCTKRHFPGCVNMGWKIMFSCL